MNSPLRINLGSGQRPFAKPFVNVDINPRWKPDVVADGTSMSMFDDGSADMIVLHHVLEHFGLGEADDMLKECWRILQPGGCLIVTVPDLEELTRAWIARRIDDYTFCVNLYGAHMGNEADRHKWAYTHLTLRNTLNKAARWPKVRPFGWREIPGADIAKDWWILGIEAVK